MQQIPSFFYLAIKKREKVSIYFISTEAYELTKGFVVFICHCVFLS